MPTQAPTGASPFIRRRLAGLGSRGRTRRLHRRAHRGCAEICGGCGSDRVRAGRFVVERPATLPRFRGAWMPRQSKRLTKRRRASALVAASWQSSTASSRSARSLRKGPRGGGRSYSSTCSPLRHVCPQAGPPRPAAADAAAIREHRNAIVAGIRAGTKGVTENGWPARYVARRAAWHVTDHAWEIEDRST